MFKKLLMLTLAACVVSGCSVRWSHWERRTAQPQPTPYSYRCFANGQPDSVGTGWCTPGQVSNARRYYSDPAPYNTPYYGS